MSRPETDEVARFWAKVTKTDTCWLWDACLDEDGYGSFRARGRRTVRAHRFAYQLHHGSIPHGLQIDHSCHNEDLTCPGNDSCLHRRCVNPEHLEAATARDNTMRSRSLPALNASKTHCPQGHPYSAENTYVRPNGNRKCRTCKRAADRRRAIRRNEGVAA